MAPNKLTLIKPAFLLFTKIWRYEILKLRSATAIVKERIEVNNYAIKF